MSVEKYILDGEYDYEEVKVYITGKMDVYDNGYFSATIKECNYNFSELNFWGVVENKNGKMTFWTMENPIKANYPNIAYYCEKESKDPVENEIIEGYYLGNMFEKICISSKKEIQRDILVRRIEDITEKLLKEMFSFKAQGCTAAINLRKVQSYK